MVLACRGHRGDGDSLRLLFDAASHGQYRVVVARPNGLPYAPARDAGIPAPPSAAVLRAAKDIVLTQHADRHAVAVALLLTARPEDALNDLEQLASKNAASAAIWNDLSAARYEAAQRRDDPRELVRALAAADAALAVDRNAPEALFNRALILDALDLREAAVSAYRSYLAADSDSLWALEVRSRLRQLNTLYSRPAWKTERPLLEAAALAGRQSEVVRLVKRHTQEARIASENEYLASWGALRIAGDPNASKPLSIARAVGEALVQLHDESLLHDSVSAVDRTEKSASSISLRILCNAHIAFRDARTAMSNHQNERGLSLLRRAIDGFRAAGSPMAYLALYYASTANYDSHRIDAAAAILRLADADSTVSHRALHSSIRWIGGMIAGVQGRLYEALVAFEDANAIFIELEERENALKTLSLQADVIVRMGETMRGYRARRKVFAGAADLGIPAAVTGALHTAVLAELFEEHWPEAISLLNVLIARDGLNPRIRSDALIRRAYAETQIAYSERADADLAAARAAITALGDEGQIALTFHDADFVSALSVRRTNPSLASAMLTGNIKFAEKHGRSLRLPELYYQRALCAMDVGDDASAIKDFDRSLALVEHRRRDISRGDLRDSFVGAHDRIYNAYLALLAKKRDYERIFEVSEHRRARLILDRLSPSTTSSPLTSVAVAEHLPAGVVVVEYATLQRALMILSIDACGLHAREISVNAEDVFRMVSSFQKAISTDAGPDAARLARSLYALLIEPVPDLSQAQLLVISPDEPLSGVPFAALCDRRSHFLIETHAIVMAASSSTYVRGIESAADTPMRRTLVIGNPSFDARLFPRLEPITEGAREAREIASLYPSAQFWTGEDATLQRLLANIGRADVVHLATHAVVNETDPSLSFLLLAPSAGNSGLLYVDEIMKLKVSARIVALAGCRTAASGAAHGSIRSLALAFAAAGARNVLATLWNIDDEQTRNATAAFHQAVSAGVSPAVALQRAQISLIKSPNPASRRYRTWAAFQLYGTGN